MRRTGASGGVERPVDVKENGIGGTAADSAPVASSATPTRAVGCDLREQQVGRTRGKLPPPEKKDP
jgi:hypothetical protein